MDENVSRLPGWAPMVQKNRTEATSLCPEPSLLLPLWRRRCSWCDLRDSVHYATSPRSCQLRTNWPVEVFSRIVGREFRGFMYFLIFSQTADLTAQTEGKRVVGGMEKRAESV